MAYPNCYIVLNKMYNNMTQKQPQGSDSSNSHTKTKINSVLLAKVNQPICTSYTIKIGKENRTTQI